VDDEGVPGGAGFGGEDPPYCIGREGVCAEAVDGFGGEGYGSIGAEDLGGALDGGMVEKFAAGVWMSVLI
jgi:hypothetical protein